MKLTIISKNRRVVGMLEQNVLKSVENYIDAIKRAGIGVEFVVVFGSQVRGKTHEWGD